MKKNYLLLLTSCLLISCAPQNNGTLTCIKIQNGEIITIDNIFLDKLINAEIDFILYVGNDTCSTCNRVHSIIDTAINKNNNLIYHIPYSGDNAYDDSSFDLPSELFTPSLLFFDDGNVVKHINYDSNSFFSSSKMESIINNEINSIDIYLINETNFTIDENKFNSIINKDNTTIIFGSMFDNKIGDFLKNEIKKYSSQKIYFYHINEFNNDTYNSSILDNEKMPFIGEYSNGILTNTILI